MLFSVHAFALDLHHPADFEYVHCVTNLTSPVPSRQIVTHYVIDVRRPERLQLHSSRASKSTKAASLQRLRLIDPLLTQIETK